MRKGLLVLALLCASTLMAQVQTLRVGTLNNIRNCNYEGFSGANAGAKIVSCIAALPSTGGTADARGFQGAQSITASITITKPVRILLGAATYTYSGTTAIFQMQSEGASIEGAGADVTVVIGGNDVDGVQIEADNVSVKNFTLRGPGRTPNDAGFIGIDHSGSQHNVTIEGMVVEDWASIGINGGTSASTAWKVINNVVRNNNQAGIQTNQAIGWLIDGNTINGNGANGVDTNGQRNRITNNYIYANGDLYLASQPIDSNGIVVTSVGGNALDNLVALNKVYNNAGSGIRIRADASGLTEHTQVLGNEVWGHADSGDGHGILIDVSVGGSCGQVNDTIIANNNSHDNALIGIAISGGSGTPCVVNRTLISGNSVTGNGDEGIFVFWGENAQVTNNVVYDNNSAGTQINTSGSTRTLVFCNLIDITINVCGMQNGSLATNTISPYSSVNVAVTSTGNTQLDLQSTGGGGRENWAWYVDTSNMHLRNTTDGANRFTIDNAGAITLPGAVTASSTLTATSTIQSNVGYNVGTGGVSITAAAGAPGGGCTTGSLYLRTNGGTGSTLYVCETGAWAAK